MEWPHWCLSDFLPHWEHNHLQTSLLASSGKFGFNSLNTSGSSLARRNANEKKMALS
jgi:hypothetical protein